jgi:integrase/recombinase XerD
VNPVFEQFIREKKFITNVSEATAWWYEQALQRLKNPDPTADDLKQLVIDLRSKGVSASSINSWRRGWNAFLHWRAFPNKKCGPECDGHLRVAQLQTEEFIPQVFSRDDIAAFMKWKPKRDGGRRVQCLALLLADTGVRISEALGLRWGDVDFDNCLLRIFRKGRKEQLVPFSIRLRPYLYKRVGKPNEFVFATTSGLAMSQRNALRDVKKLCQRLNVRCNRRLLHSFRHSFASNAVKEGMHPLVLQRLLGHRTPTMTNKYVTLATGDLQQRHVSML